MGKFNRTFESWSPGGGNVSLLIVHRSPGAATNKQKIVPAGADSRELNLTPFASVHVLRQG